MIVTTTPSIEGHKITNYAGIVAGEAIMRANVVRGKEKLQVFRGDDLLQGIKPDMIEIDVEGMELQVLAGLKDTLKSTHPLTLIEGDNENGKAFLKWAKDNKYTILKTYQRYRLNKNFVLADAAKAKDYPDFGAAPVTAEPEKPAPVALKKTPQDAVAER